METDTGEKVVNARDLYEGLRVKEKFTEWIARKIKDYDFVKNVDFISFSEKSKKPKGGRPTQEYILRLGRQKNLLWFRTMNRVEKFEDTLLKWKKKQLVNLNNPNHAKSQSISYSVKKWTWQKH